MNKKQIEALTALRDVMREHNVEFCAAYDKNHFCAIDLIVDGVLVFEEVLDVKQYVIDEILEQETE